MAFEMENPHWKREWKNEPNPCPICCIRVVQCSVCEILCARPLQTDICNGWPYCGFGKRYQIIKDLVCPNCKDKVLLQTKLRRDEQEVREYLSTVKTLKDEHKSKEK